jgi:hypothetical protein
MVDTEKLTDAFSAFKRAAKKEFGATVWARQNFWCCQTCASADFSVKRDKKKNPNNIIGTVYYTQQSAASMRKGDDLWVSYGAFSGGDEITVKIGKIFCEIAKEKGLSVEWDENPREKIRIIA